MFVETITMPRDRWDHFSGTSELVTDPPDGLLALVSYEEGTDDVTVVHVWDTPAARGDFAVERVMPRFTEEELAVGGPDRRTPVDTYIRGITTS